MHVRLSASRRRDKVWVVCHAMPMHDARSAGANMGSPAWPDVHCMHCVFVLHCAGVGASTRASWVRVDLNVAWRRL